MLFFLIACLGKMEILVYLCICILFHLLGMPKLLEDLNFLSQENVVHSCQRYVAQVLAHSIGDTTHSSHGDRTHGNPNPFFQLLTSGPLIKLRRVLITLL